jgi:Tol biopolymer transport system component
MRMYLLVAAVAALVVAGCGGPGAASQSTAPSVAAVATADPSVAASASPPGSPPAIEGRPVLKPGEPWLVYAWYPESLYLVRSDGSDRHRLDLGVEGEPFAASWSSDGERLAFVLRGDATEAPNGAIWTADADGTGAAALYGGADACPDGAYWPAWSPDGTRLALICYEVKGDKGFTSVAILDPATGTRTDLATFTYPQTIDNAPSWAPDGSALTFESITWDPTDQFIQTSVVATVPTAGGEVTVLTDPELFAGHPDWSPDGSRIAFSTYDTGNIHGIQDPSNVYTIAPDGSGLRQVSTASTDGTMRLGQPFWSADGSRIVVSVARDWDKDSTGQPKNTLGWVDATTGAFTEIGTEGKRFRERPEP